MDIFERNKVKIILSIVLFFVVILTIITEISLKSFFGLGNPVLYDSYPLYGYRPLPNKEYKRFRGSNIRFNNLGLRCDRDWDQYKENKILFLGDSVTYGGSYIDNKDLFSALAVQGLQGYESGNAGVNAWGVENIYGLIVETNFTPAKIYVTVLLEGDFYRGVTRIQVGPFYNIKPKFALTELLDFLCYQQNNNRFKAWNINADFSQKEKVVRKAALKLWEMDDFLKSKGFKHLIFISPYKNQILGDAKDDLVFNMLKENEIRPIYISDKLKEFNIKNDDKLFSDGMHLEKKGHELWGKIIKNELMILLNSQSH